MAKRERTKVEIVEPAEVSAKAPKNNYFTDSKPNIEFVSTGCTILDCALGGGFPLGRIVNLVGDKSTSKTGLAMETLINFMRRYPNGVAAYRDVESAFDVEYAQAMGLKTDKVDLGADREPLATVEDFHRDLILFMKEKPKDVPGIYVLDSLDALSDEAEMERDISKGTFGASKAKQLSTMFRILTGSVSSSNTLLLIVSQVRDNIGAMMGDKHKRSGGRALDFYASQIVFLTHMKTLKRTVKSVERPYGIAVKAKIKKNKVGLPLREAEFEYHFGYGVEDVFASVDWLTDVKRTGDIGLTPEVIKGLNKMSNAEYDLLKDKLSKTVQKVWAEIETEFLPTRRKYSEETPS